MSRGPRPEGAATPEELRERVQESRERLGATVEELAAKADVKARAREKAAQMRDRVRGKGAHTRKRALHPVQERTPEPVRDSAGRPRGRPAWLIAAGATGLAFLAAVLVSRRGWAGGCGRRR